MIEYSDQEFEKKLMLLKDTQDAIQSLSTWCLKRHENYKSIISIWLKAIRKMKIEKRLTLFYLANDVIQYSKKKNYKFVDGWATAIQKAIPYVRDEKIQSKISRIIKIWEERVVYDDNYLSDLTGLLTTPIQKLKLADPVQDFQINTLAVKIRSCVKLEQITDLKMKILKETNLPLTNNESIQNMMKDRTRSHEFLNELNDGMAKIESYIKCLKRETVDRAQLIDALEVATSYYDEQSGEVKTVAEAYFNYTNRVKLLKTKLESLASSMPTNSPMPSPDINAPSPSSSSVSIEDLSIHNLSYEHKHILNSDKLNFSMENNDIVNNDNDVYVPTTIAKIKSYMTPETINTFQELYDPASLSFPVIENPDIQTSSGQFPYDAPSPPPDETFSTFPSETNLPYNNEINNQNNNSTTYLTNNYEAYVPTPIPSGQSYETSDFSIIIPSTNSTPVVNETSVPITHVHPTGNSLISIDERWQLMNPKFSAWDGTVHNSWSTNDTPASPPFHEKVSYQDTPIITKTDRRPDIDHCALELNILDRDERIIPQKIIPETSDIDHRNLISLTNSPHMNSPVISSDVDYRTFPGIPMPPSPPPMLLDAVIKTTPKDNVESVDMDLSDDDDKPKLNLDQKHPILLPPPPLPPMPFDFDQQNIPDVTNQWEQSCQQWNNERYIENQWNVEQPEVGWKHPNQWEQEQSDLNFVHNQTPHQWPQHDPRLRGDFRPQWKGGNNNWPRGPRNFNQPSRSNRWNQGPHFGPRNRPW